MKEKIKNLKKIITSVSADAKEGHVPSGMSIMDILWVLYDKVLKIDPSDPENPNRDIFILSKGHGSLGLYAVLAEKGFFSFDYFKNFCKYESNLGGHPDYKKIPGVEASTGSLGHGFPMAVGVALGMKINKKSNKVYCLIGDGECNEGTIWESALIAPHHKLNNLTCVIDHNHSTDRALVVDDLIEKFKSFGWEAFSIDGHDHEKIFEALNKKTINKPKMIIAETVKGRGSKTMENNPEWHHKSPTDEELKMLLEEII